MALIDELELNPVFAMDRILMIKAEIHALEAELKQLQTQVMLAIDPETPKIYHDGFYFQIVERATWEYPPEVRKLEAELKKMKKQAEQDGSAEPTYNQYLRVFATKDD